MVQESLSRELQIERDKNKSLTERVSSFKIRYHILLLLVGTHGSKPLLVSCRLCELPFVLSNNATVLHYC
jgi:hypothetical protein